MEENDAYFVEIGKRFVYLEGQFGDSFRGGENDNRSKKKNYDIKYYEIQRKNFQYMFLVGNVFYLGYLVKL